MQSNVSPWQLFLAICVQKQQTAGVLYRVFLISYTKLSCNNTEGRKLRVKRKVKESCKRPGVVQRVPGGLGSQISITFGTWRWWVHQPHAPAPLPPGMFLVLIFTRSWVDPRTMVRSEGNMSLKKPVTPPGINPGTVRLVAQRLNPGPTENLQYYDIYISQCSVCLCVIHRYSQLFNVVTSCHMADVPSVSIFIPNSINHVHTYGHNCFCYPFL